MSPFAPPFHLPRMEAVVNRRMYALLLVLMIPGPAAAQAPGGASASDEPLPRWDTTGFLGWRGTRVDETEYNTSRWDARFVYGGTVGYYWTCLLYTSPSPRDS